MTAKKAAAAPAKKTAAKKAAPAKKTAAKKTSKKTETEEQESPEVEVNPGAVHEATPMGEGHALHGPTSSSLNPAFYPQG